MNLIFHLSEIKVSSTAGSMWTLFLEDRIPCQITEIISHFTFYTFKHFFTIKIRYKRISPSAKKYDLKKSIILLNAVTVKKQILEAWNHKGGKDF